MLLVLIALVAPAQSRLYLYATLSLCVVKCIQKVMVQLTSIFLLEVIPNCRVIQ